MGCGVTAFDVDDAVQFLVRCVYPVYGAREIVKIIENIDVSNLDEDHVRNNMGAPAVRGVWFPLL